MSSLADGITEYAPLAVAEPAALQSTEELVRVYWKGVFRFLLASVRDYDAAETLTQDCFLKAHHARGKFRGECSARTWLMQIAVNLARDHARNRRLQFWRRTSREAADIDDHSLQLATRELSPESRTAAVEELRAVWRAAAGLSEKQRSVFLLRFVEDMDILEIAAATGLKEGTVKTHLFRALQHVRSAVQGAR